METKRGFTLIELMISVFIIVSLASFVLLNYRDGQKKYALSQAAQKLVSDLRRAQNMAISGTGIKGQYCGYGIETNYSSRPYSYRFYADVSSNCDVSDNGFGVADDYVVETVNLPSGIKFRSTSPVPLDVFFKPPQPVTYVNKSSALGEAFITLEIEGSSLPAKTININTSGLIQVQ